MLTHYSHADLHCPMSYIGSEGWWKAIHVWSGHSQHLQLFGILWWALHWVAIVESDFYLSLFFTAPCSILKFPCTSWSLCLVFRFRWGMRHLNMHLQGVLLQEVLGLKDLVKPYLGMRSMEELMRSFFWQFHVLCIILVWWCIIICVVCFIFRASQTTVSICIGDCILLNGALDVWGDEVKYFQLNKWLPMRTSECHSALIMLLCCLQQIFNRVFGGGGGGSGRQHVQVLILLNPCIRSWEKIAPL